jgi:hypothetical protein
VVVRYADLHRESALAADVHDAGRVVADGQPAAASLAPSQISMAMCALCPSTITVGVFGGNMAQSLTVRPCSSGLYWWYANMLGLLPSASNV